MRTPCTLDEATARKILPGIQSVQDQRIEAVSEGLRQIDPGMGRLRALRALHEFHSKLMGPRMFLYAMDKRRYSFLAGTLHKGEIHFTIWHAKATSRGPVCLNENVCYAHMGEHATARLFQRLRTTDADQAWAELRPAAGLLYALAVGKIEIPEGEVARVPTRTGHLVVPEFSSEGPTIVTFNTDVKTGDERLAHIRRCREEQTVYFCPDRSPRSQGGTTGGTELAVSV